MKKIVMPSPVHQTKNTRYIPTRIGKWYKNNLCCSRKNVICVFPEKGKTCLIHDRNTIRLNHPKHSQQFWPLQNWKVVKKNWPEKEVRKATGCFSFLKWVLFFIISPKTQRVVPNATGLFKVFQKGKFHNH